MKIVVTDIRPSEARQAQLVFNATWRVTYPNKKARITLADIRHRQQGSLGKARIQKRREMIKNLPRNEKYLVAKVGNKVIGVCIAIKHKDKNVLSAIYVLPKYQGKGVGGLLWNAVKNFLNPKKDTVVHVATYNLNAIRFYKKLGFRVSRRRFLEERLRMKSGSIIPQTEMVRKA